MQSLRIIQILIKTVNGAMSLPVHTVWQSYERESYSPVQFNYSYIPLMTRELYTPIFIWAVTLKCFAHLVFSVIFFFISFILKKFYV